MWLTNPDNVIRRNAVADIQGNGYWYAIPQVIIGHPSSVGVSFDPHHLVFGTFEDNVAHSVNEAGLMFDKPKIAASTHQAFPDPPRSLPSSLVCSLPPSRFPLPRS